MRQYKPETVIVPAYEGGHPDHDSCSFLGALLRRKLQSRVWEMPLYHRSPTGKLICAISSLAVQKYFGRKRTTTIRDHHMKVCLTMSSGNGQCPARKCARRSKRALYE